MSDQKQAVVDETKVVAEPTTEVDGARNDGNIDEILSQYDQETKVAPPPEPKPKTPDIPPEWAKPLIAKQRQDEYREAIAEFFGDRKISERLAKGWIDTLVAEKPSLAHAYFNRQKDPAAWNKVKKWAQAEWDKDNPAPVDQTATADREAVAAAVRGSSTKVTAEPAPKLGTMSDAELRKYTLENFGF